MNKNNTSYLCQHEDILSFRDLAVGTVNTYVSYLSQFIDWTESFLGAKPLPDISWEEIRSYIRYLKDVRSLNPRTINVHIAQLLRLQNLQHHNVAVGHGTVVNQVIFTHQRMTLVGQNGFFFRHRDLLKNIKREAFAVAKASRQDYCLSNR